MRPQGSGARPSRPTGCVLLTLAGRHILSRGQQDTGTRTHAGTGHFPRCLPDSGAQSRLRSSISLPDHQPQALPSGLLGAYPVPTLLPSSLLC